MYAYEPQMDNCVYAYEPQMETTVLSPIIPQLLPFFTSSVTYLCIVHACKTVPYTFELCPCHCLRAQEHEQAVVSAYLEREASKQEAAQKQRMRAARTAWTQLLQVSCLSV